MFLRNDDYQAVGIGDGTPVSFCSNFVSCFGVHSFVLGMGVLVFSFFSKYSYLWLKIYHDIHGCHLFKFFPLLLYNCIVCVLLTTT